MCEWVCFRVWPDILFLPNIIYFSVYISLSYFFNTPKGQVLKKCIFSLAIQTFAL